MNTVLSLVVVNHFVGEIADKAVYNLDRVLNIIESLVRHGVLRCRVRLGIHEYQRVRTVRPIDNNVLQTGASLNHETGIGTHGDGRTVAAGGPDSHRSVAECGIGIERIVTVFDEVEGHFALILGQGVLR